MPLDPKLISAIEQDAQKNANALRRAGELRVKKLMKRADGAKDKAIKNRLVKQAAGVARITEQRARKMENIAKTLKKR